MAISRHLTPPVLISALALGGCATSGGYLGASGEAAHAEQQAALERARRLNNDDYFQVERDGRVWVFSDPHPYRTFMAGKSPEQSDLVRAAGPDGRSVVFVRSRDEPPAAAPAAAAMFTGQREGAADFFAVVQHDGRWYVFDRWSNLERFRRQPDGIASIAMPGRGPDGGAVRFVPGPGAASSSRLKAAARAFALLHAGI